ncbi:MAG: hypothetical protein FWD65_06305 [Coriobacteriia bacterium]|nr:hypothetical protein [Coriobacteriia bacterium]
MKKKLLIIALAVALAFVGLAVYVVRSGLWANRAWFLQPTCTIYVDNFDKYSKDFQVLANFALKESKEHDYPEGSYIGVDSSDGLKLFYSEDFEVISLTDQVQKSLERVNQSFHDAGGEFGAIFIYKDRLSFEINNDYFAVVYSLNGSKPVYVPPPGEESNPPIHQIKRLKGNWWTVATD